MNRWTMALLTVLRIVVGWHFLYEGLWKIDSDRGTAAYTTSWYVLHSSIARLRADVQGATAAAVSARADQWYDEVVKAFKGRTNPLAEDQKARLAELRDKVKLAAAAGEDPAGFDWAFVRDEVLLMTPPPPEERFSALPFLEESAGPLRPLFRGLVRDMDGFRRVTLQSGQAALDERAAVISKHYRFRKDQEARLLQARDNVKGALAATLNDAGFRARVEDYGRLRQRVSRDSGVTTAPFSRERLAEDRRKLDAIASELLGAVNEPLVELSVQAQTIATPEQMGAGPVPRPGEPAAWIDSVMKWSLVAIGACLLAGLFTPFAAVAAAVQLAMFYLASPPWPGLPAATMGGHYLYVDRNLIELVAALAIAASGTGAWAGLDGIVARLRARRVEVVYEPERATAASR
jgi:uncharacterized membrane protein YphA (DoxX/SURF4 family)